MIKIRKARLDEMDRLLELWGEFMAQQRGLAVDQEDMLPAMRENAEDIVGGYFSRSIRSRHGLVLVVEEGDDIHGYMLSRIQKNIPVFREEYIGYVSDIYLEEEYRGKGISSGMWMKTGDWFRRKGIEEISIRVLHYNDAAYSVYRGWGFKDYLKEMRMDL